MAESTALCNLYATSTKEMIYLHYTRAIWLDTRKLPIRNIVLPLVASDLTPATLREWSIGPPGGCCRQANRSCVKNNSGSPAPSLAAVALVSVYLLDA
jgi:hypothetical protein